MIVDLERVLAVRAAQRATAVLQQFPDTIPVVRPAENYPATGSSDPIGDDQCERSGWGDLEECAVEGGVFALPVPAGRIVSEGQLTVLIVCIAVLAAVLCGLLIALIAPWVRSGT